MKAYYVERITRAVTLAVVYADNPDDAKARYLGGEIGDLIGTEHEGRGFGRVHRAPEYDRPRDTHAAPPGVREGDGG